MLHSIISEAAVVGDKLYIEIIVLRYIIYNTFITLIIIFIYIDIMRVLDCNKSIKLIS